MGTNGSGQHLPEGGINWEMEGEHVRIMQERVRDYQMSR